MESKQSAKAARAQRYRERRPRWTPLLELTAAISLNLGIFNLLPIPILDGGVIMFLLIEGLMGRDISLRIKERVYQAAFVFLVLFAVMVGHLHHGSLRVGLMLGRAPLSFAAGDPRASPPGLSQTTRQRRSP